MLMDILGPLLKTDADNKNVIVLKPPIYQTDRGHFGHLSNINKRSNHIPR